MTSTPRRLLRIAGRTAQAVAYVVLFLVLVLLITTRTQVGRDGLRDQLQAQFDERFAGTLDIGQLQGSLLYSLYARDVVLRAPDGRPVVTLDSLAARPRWSALWGEGLSLRRLTLVRPHVVAHRQDDSSWSLQAALRPLQSTGARRAPPDVVIDRLEVIDGRLTTRTDAPLPAAITKGWAFNYLQNEATRIGLLSRLVWTADEKRVAIDRASLRLEQPDVGPTTLSGVVRQEGTTWRADDLRLATASSTVVLDASVDPLPSNPVLDVRLQADRLNFDALQRLVPRLPLRDEAALEARLYGSVSQLVVERVRMRRGDSRAEVTGTVLGLPDSLDVEANVVDTRLAAADVQAIWPGAPKQRLSALRTVTAQAFAKGTVQWQRAPHPRVRMASDFTLRSPTAGVVSGSLRVRRETDRPWQYALRSSVRDLNLAPLTLRPGATSALNGTVRIDGHGTPGPQWMVNTHLRLRPSRVRTQQLDSLQADLSVDGPRIRAVVQGQQADGGALVGTATLDRGADRPTYRFDLRGTLLDLKPVHPALPTTRLTGRIRLNGSGHTLANADATMHLRVDSSAVGAGDSVRVLPPHTLRVDVSPRRAEGPRLRATGSVGSLTLAGDVAAKPLGSTARLWGTALRDAVRRQVNKPRPDTLRPDTLRPDTLRPPDRRGDRAEGRSETPSDAQAKAMRASEVPGSTGSARSASSPPAAVDDLQAKARAQLRKARFLRPLRIRADLEVQQSEVIRAWWPALPRLPENITTQARLTLDADTLHMDGVVRIPRAVAGRTGGIVADSAALSFRAGGSLRAPLADTWRTDLTFTADTLRSGGAAVRDVALSAAYARRQGVLRVSGRGANVLDTLRLDLGLAVRPDRNDLTLHDLRVVTRTDTWRTAGPGRIALYRDAAVIHQLAVESPRAFSNASQRLQARGVLSASPADTVSVNAEGVSVYSLTQLLGIRRSLGGLVNGNVALLGGLTAPRIRSDLTVRRFSFDRRLLGRVRLATRYVPQNADIEVDLRLDAEPLPLDTLRARFEPLVPGGVRRVEPSALRLSGRLRLPRDDRPSRELLDLSLDVKRADLFFFEYIFAQEITKVTGYTTGTATITGSLPDPLFDADMEVRNGAFTLPRFGLEYGIAGDVDVDERGIHMRDVEVQDDDGRARLDGSLLFNDYRYFSFDLRGVLDELLIINVAKSDELPFYGSIRASGSATLTGPLSNATLRSEAATTTPESELFIPVSETDVADDAGFIIFADSTGALPDLQRLTQRANILADRPEGEPTFVDGLEIDVNIIAPQQSTVHLVFDPLVGDVVTAVGSGRIQLQRLQGEFFVYGRFDVTSGTYLFTAGEVFVRRFSIEGGTLTWDGNPTNARLDLQAAYRTRASTDGLPGLEDQARRIPVVVNLDITGFVETPRVDLSLSSAQNQRSQLVGTPTLDAIFNQPELATEYATSVLLTNTFLLTTSSVQGTTAEGGDERLARAGNQLAFNSVSQLVASQLNRYLNEALPNVDLNLGVQGEDTEDLDIIYGVALRLLDERLIIRGEGVYTSDPTSAERPQAQGPQGEVVVEVQLSQRVSAEVFYRRTGDDLTRGQTLTSSAGAGLTYQTEFPTWKRLFYRLFGWLVGDPETPADDAPEDDPEAPPASPPPARPAPDPDFDAGRSSANPSAARNQLPPEQAPTGASGPSTCAPLLTPAWKNVTPQPNPLRKRFPVKSLSGSTSSSPAHAPCASCS